MLPGYLQIYFFSGTGNARHVAGWVSSEAQERNIPCTVTDLTLTDRKHPEPPLPGSMVAFISPTHGFNYPPVMIYFLFRFPRSHGNTAFLMNTRAGLKLSKWFVPGLSGIALWLGASVLFLKGYRIKGLRSIDLPSNWISLHPGVRKHVVASIYEHCRKVTIKFAGKVLEGRTVLTAFRDIVQDLLVAPVAIGYFFVGRFLLAKTFYANEKCDRCDVCVKNCPVKAILIVDKRPFWSYRCESCMRCMNHCPQRAIETAHGYLTGALLLLTMVVTVYFWKGVSMLISLPKDEGWMQLVFTATRWVLCFITMVITYRAFHYLLRVPVIRELFYYTSFTRLRSWRRYRPPSSS